MTKISVAAFANNKIEHLELSPTITHIEEGAFAVNNLKIIELPALLQKISKFAFMANSGATEAGVAYHIPKASVESMTNTIEKGPRGTVTWEALKDAMEGDLNTVLGVMPHPKGD